MKTCCDECPMLPTCDEMAAMTPARREAIISGAVKRCDVCGYVGSEPYFAGGYNLLRCFVCDHEARCKEPDCGWCEVVE